MTPDHYATLGVPPTAKAGEIRAAYLALMREYHPDRNRDPAAAGRAQAVIAAYKVLGDFDRRNHYDWDRRREREAAEAAAAARPRRIRAGVVAASAVGLAAAGAWVLTPARPIDPDRRGARVAEARAPVAVADRPRPKPEMTRVADAAPVTAKAARDVAVPSVDPPAPPVRVENAEPERIAPKRPLVRVAAVEPVRVPPVVRPKVERAPPVRVAVAEPLAKTPAAPRPVAKDATKVATKVASRPPAGPVRQAAPASGSGDLATLDQFVMSFYGQSWRYGDAPKRAALEQSRSSFVVRRGACAADACKRAAYLKLMRDVSEIVETGAPKSR